MNHLRSLLKRIDGKGYKAYKDLKGSYRFDRFELTIDHVQGDPFAAPSRISIRVVPSVAKLPSPLWDQPTRRIALEDYLGRSVAAAIRRFVKGNRGIGKSGQVDIATSGQQILLRNAIILSASGVEARLTVGLPAAGRTILSRDAEAIFFKELPKVVDAALLWPNLDTEQARRHILSAENQQALRAQLADKGLVAFIADGAHLPRASGVDDRPLHNQVVPLEAPESLACHLQPPNGLLVRGLGIPAGVTVIAGGGFHGKSTLLHALERGVYNHIPGDGREQVVTDPSAVKIRAEDGRWIHQVNISPFIRNLPFGRDTVQFSTENASGSTSQAANIMEALECGARLLLIDEDTSATNFMIRDEKMQKLVTGDKEPITPLLHRARELYERHGISSIIVMGGSGDYLAIADTVIMLDCYRISDVTERARRIASEGKHFKAPSDAPPLNRYGQRTVHRAILDPSRGRKDVKIEARGTSSILYGRHEVDLSRVEQLIDPGQTQSIGLALHAFAKTYGVDTPLIEGLEELWEALAEKGLDQLAPFRRGDLALPRLYEIAAAINRLRPKR